MLLTPIIIALLLLLGYGIGKLIGPRAYLVPMVAFYLGISALGAVSLVSFGYAAGVFTSNPHHVSLTKNSELYIRGAIEKDSSIHNENIKTIKNAASGDKITIFMNTPGGDLDVADQYINAIQQSKACVTVHITKALSAGFRIAARGHRLVFKPEARFMSHWGGYRFFIENPTPEDIQRVENELTYRLKQYFYVFTPEERKVLLARKDVYLIGAVITERTRHLPKTVNPLSGKREDTKKQCG